VQPAVKTVKFINMRLFRAARSISIRFARIALGGLFVCCALQGLAAGTNSPIGFFENNYKESQKRFATETNDATAAWEFGRACFDMSTMQKNTAAQALFAEEGIAACQHALALNPSSAPAHYYLGMDMGRLADTKRNLAALRMVKDMEREFLAARALDKQFDYAGPDRNLGLLYRDAPVIASIGSRAKARQHLEQAVEIAPEFPENQLNLLEVYVKWDYHNEAERQFGELEKMWPAAQKNFTGVGWVMSWSDWNKRLDAIKKKLEKNSKTIESPHAQ
jgi:tetratricopeptide (TPR) repeat protein